MDSRRRLIGLAGLPRSGSTLLSAILCQNPRIHAEGNSAVCQITWDIYVSTRTTAREQLAANHRELTGDEIISSVWKTYYRNVTRPIIVDKCRSWTLEANLDLMRRFITDRPRIIVLTRPLGEIVNSFERIYKKNRVTFSRDALFVPHSEPLMRSFDGVEWAKKHNRGEFHFLTYDALVNKPQESLDEIYEFIEEPRYEHDFDRIHNPYPEDDSVYGLNGLHDIRPCLGHR